MNRYAILGRGFNLAKIHNNSSDRFIFLLPLYLTTEITAGPWMFP